MQYLIYNKSFECIANDLKKQTTTELKQKFDSLSSVCKQKIKHTYLHNKSIQELARQKNVLDLQRYVCHDVDKIVYYLQTNTLEKFMHKAIAEHHQADLMDLLKGQKLLGMYEEKILDYECSGMSKYDRADNAYQVVAKHTNNNQDLLKIIVENGYTKEKAYKPITEKEYHKQLDLVSWTDIENLLRLSNFI